MKYYICILLTLNNFAYSNNNKIAIPLSHALRAVKENNATAALQHFTTVYNLDPHNEIALLQLGTMYLHNREYEKSCKFYEEYVSLHPDHANTVYNLGLAYIRQGIYDKALPLFKHSYQISPDDQSYAELLKGYLRNENWNAAYSLLPTTLWWYDKNIYGKTVLLELNKPGNGVGDTIQFLRYAKYLKQAGARVIVQTFDFLIPLCKQCPFIDQVIGNVLQPPFDLSYSICIASLMIRMQDHMHMESRDTPYIKPNTKLVEHWRDQLAQDHTFKVGLCWNSRPNRAQFMGKTLPNPRDITLETFRPLTNIPGVTFYCLQKNYHGEEDFPLTLFGNSFDESEGSFIDSAAIIPNLDLVITIDTGIAHLAGALGAPVCTILACESDYRWFRDRTDTPWYPSMTLFRQQTYNDWHSVIAQIKHELSKLTLLEL